MPLRSVSPDIDVQAPRDTRFDELDAGVLPDLLPQTQQVRAAAWTVAPIPRDLTDRRVEITGPVDRKMIINALNSGARVFMADFEDSHAPTWRGTIEGQINLRDAVRGSISHVSPEGKPYRLNDRRATLMVRPRGWHLVEKHVLVDGAPISASLFDFGLFFFHNAAALVAQGTGPYFYLPKLESHLEARLWNDVFNLAQDELGLPRGTIRATVLIETISPRSRWTRSSTSCASIPPASTAAAGTTSSASSRNSGTGPAPSFPIVPRSRWTGIS